MLTVEKVNLKYGAAQVLWGVDLTAERGMAANTVLAYGRDLDRYAGWVAGGGLADYLHPSIRDLTHYLGHLRDERLAPPSVARHLVALKMFYRFLRLEERTNESTVDVLASPILWERIPQVLSPESVEKLLAVYSKAFTVHRTGAYPVYAHLGSGPRVGEFMLVVKPPYYVAGSASYPWYAHAMGVTWAWSDTFTPDFGGLKASHGYDPAIPEMHGIFYAWGAGVAKGKEIAQVDMVDIHPTVMSLLGLAPGNPVDGKVAANVLSGSPTLQIAD